MLTFPWNRLTDPLDVKVYILTILRDAGLPLRYDELTAAATADDIVSPLDFAQTFAQLLDAGAVTLVPREGEENPGDTPAAAAQPPREGERPREDDTPRENDVARDTDETRENDISREDDTPRETDISQETDVPREIDISQEVDVTRGADVSRETSPAPREVARENLSPNADNPSQCSLFGEGFLKREESAPSATPPAGREPPSPGDLFAITPRGRVAADALRSRVSPIIRDRGLAAALDALRLSRIGGAIRTSAEPLPDGRCRVIIAAYAPEDRAATPQALPAREERAGEGREDTPRGEEVLYLRLLLDTPERAERARELFNDRPEHITRAILSLLTGEAGFLLDK